MATSRFFFTLVLCAVKKFAHSWLVWFSGLSVDLQTKGHQFDFLVRAHAQGAGQVPIWGHVRGNHGVSLPLSPSLPLSLK